MDHTTNLNDAAGTENTQIHDQTSAALPNLGDMDPEEFRRFGHQTIDWVADYLANAARYPVLSQVKPGQVRAALEGDFPAQGTGMDAIMADFRDQIMPGITHWNSPGFMAYFGITASGPGILGELLAAALNVNGMLWRTSPSVTEVEEVATGWLARMLGLDFPFGMINDTASTSSLYALAAARESLTDLDVRRQGLTGHPVPRLCVYTSEEAHSSIEKACLTLGIGQEGVRKIGTDEQFRMRPDLLRAAIEADLAVGHRPMAVSATIGTTSTTSIDPVPEIAAICKQYRIWLHVDAAYAGPVALAPEYRWILDGCNEADSLVTNPHKWLFTPIDCSILYCRHPQVFKRAFSLSLAILETSEGDTVTNLMDYGNALGRRFRGLKLWMVLRYFGQEGLAARIRSHIQLAQELESWIKETPDWEILAPTPFSTVNFRFHPQHASEEELNQLNSQIEETVNARGQVYLSHTSIRGRYALRAAVGNLRTTHEHVGILWEQVQEAASNCSRTGTAY